MTTKTSGERPNIIFVLSDQQRWDTVGCYGQEIHPGITPHIDRMAKEGVRFEHAFTCQPVCGPARSCLQTGKWATETGCFRNGIALPTDELTIARHLSRAGYEVGYIGKWHLASTVSMGIDFQTRAVPHKRRGGYVDFWISSDVLEFTSHSYDGHMFDGDMRRVEFPENRYRVDCLTDFAIERLHAWDGKRPLFMFISYVEPHQQNDHQQFEGPRGSKERFAAYKPPQDLVGADGDWKKELPDYLGQVNSLDSNLGRIRDELARLDMADNTLIVYTSDHGCHFRTRNGEYKRSCHESSIRVPMILHGPGFLGGRVIKELVSLIDLTPTILLAAGLDPPGYMRGQSLQQLVGDRKPEWRKDVFIQISESQVGRAIRTKRWKYSVRAPDSNGWDRMNSDTYVEECLYDLEADHHERNNLVLDPGFSKVRARLAKRLKRRMAMAGEAIPIIKRAV